MKLKQIVPAYLSECRAFIDQKFREKRNSNYRVLFNTHISTYFDAGMMSGNVPRELRTAFYCAIIPLALLSKTTGGRLKVAFLDTRDEHFRKTVALMDYFDAEYVACDLGDVAEFSRLYDAWSARPARRDSARKKVINPTEAALLREIQVGLLLRHPGGNEREREVIDDDPELSRLETEILDARKEAIHIHAEYALSQLFESESSVDPAMLSMLNNSRVDMLVSMRSARSQPRYGGAPLFGAEFDGPSHALEDQKKNDEIKNKIFKEGKVPLLRVGVRSEDECNNLQPVRNNDGVIERPGEISVFLRQIIAVLYDYRRSSELLLCEQEWLKWDGVFAELKFRKDVGWDSLKALMVEQLTDNLCVDDCLVEHYIERRLLRVRRAICALKSSQEDYHALLEEDYVSILADRGVLECETIGSLESLGMTQIQRRKFDQMYAVDDVKVVRGETGISGEMRYRARSIRAGSAEQIVVGPFDVRVIASPEDCELFDKVLGVAVTNVLYERACERENLTDEPGFG